MIKTIALGLAVVFAAVAAALIPFTTFYPYFVVATFTPAGDDCVVANVGAVNSAWNAECAGGALPEQEFEVTTTEFWPLFPVHAPDAVGNPLGPFFAAGNLTEFETCEKSLGVASFAIGGLIGGITTLLDAQTQATLHTLLENTLSQVQGDGDTMQTAYNVLGLNFAGTPAQAFQASAIGANLPTALGLAGQCYCNFVAPEQQYNLTIGANTQDSVTLSMPNACPAAVPLDRNGLFGDGAFGSRANVPLSLADCFERQAAYQPLKQLSSAFNIDVGTGDDLVQACEDDSKDIEAISTAKLMLFVSTGVAAAAFLSTFGACVVKGPAVTVVAALLSFAACAITLVALLTVRSAPIYSAVGREGCTLCYSNSTSFYTGLGAIAAPGVAGLLLLGSLCCSSGDEEEKEALVNQLDEEP